MFKGKNFICFTTLVSPNNFKDNDKIILSSIRNGTITYKKSTKFKCFIVYLLLENQIPYIPPFTINLYY